VVLLHGFGDSGDMWAPIAAKLVATHTVIVPDLRGMGLSRIRTVATPRPMRRANIAGVMDALKVDKAQLVTHDIGNMVGYAWRAISRAYHQMDRDRCAAAGCGQLGGAAQQSQDLAFQFLWPG